MATVLHSGRTVISNYEGGWIITPGTKGRDQQIIKLARATKLRVKDLGANGANIWLNIDFCGTTSAFNSFKNRIENLYDMTIGTLAVPEQSGTSSYQDTIFIDSPQWGEQVAIDNNKILVSVSLQLLIL